MNIYFIGGLGTFFVSAIWFHRNGDAFLANLSLEQFFKMQIYFRMILAALILGGILMTEMRR